MNEDVLQLIRKALGRSEGGAAVPVPPMIDESIVRLAGAGDDLSSLFTHKCEENKLHVTPVGSSELAARLAEFLRGRGIRRVAISCGGLLQKLSIPAALRVMGIEARSWDQLTLDDVYDFDCGLTDVDYAVAETGTLAVLASTGNGRSLSLVPPLHIAVVEKSRIVPDLIDLLAALSRDGTGSAVSLITGPSKTSDIEMILVVGVHGPMQVEVFLVD